MDITPSGTPCKNIALPGIIKDVENGVLPPLVPNDIARQTCGRLALGVRAPESLKIEPDFFACCKYTPMGTEDS